MMSDPTTVDRVTQDEQSGKLVLVIEEHRPWDQPATMHRELASKVKNYVRHIRSKEFAREHGRSPDETIVRLVSAKQPTQGTLKFLERVKYELGKHGILFEHTVGTPPSSTTAAEDRSGGPAAPPAPDRPAEETGGARQTPPQQAQPKAPDAGAPGTPDTGRARQKPPERDERPADAARGAGHTEARRPPEPPESGAAERENRVLNVPDDPDAERRPEFWPEEEFGPVSRQKAESLDDASEQSARGGPGQPRGTAAERGGEDEIWIEMPGDAELPASEDDVEAWLKPEADRAASAAAAASDEMQPSILKAITGALTAALAGGALWGLLAVAAETGASPLAPVIGLMVGFTVRVRGGGRSLPYNVVAALGTILGCLVGSLLAAAAYVTLSQGGGIAGIVTVLSDPNAAVAALRNTYNELLDLVLYALAIYLGFRAATPGDSD